MKALGAMPGRPPSEWALEAPFGTRALIVTLLVAALLWLTGQRVEMGRMLALTSHAIVAAATGSPQDSQVLRGLQSLGRSLWPLQVSERTEVLRIEGFNRNELPWGAHLEVVERSEQRLNPSTLQMESTTTRSEWLVEPMGYLRHVVARMAETLEIALWGTLLAAILSVPLAIAGSASYTPHRSLYWASRVIVSALRAVPELISALFLVLAFGFGPIAGVLALALHAAGFLGKFYAEDIDSADPRPQHALRAIGTRPLAVLRHAVLPEIAPKVVAYTLYVLDRNVRMATVVGLVGAGGIGQELKGRYDMYQYGHVATILVAIFVTVFVLDQAAAHWRRRWA